MKKILLLLLAVAVQVSGQTLIYRSAQQSVTTAIATGTGNNLTISSTTATFASALPDSIGVGDAIQYDSDNNGTVDAICFIHGRTSSTVYTVANAAGGTPTATAAADQDWSIFRSYSALVDWESRTENTGIIAALRDFDTGATRDISANNEQWHVAGYGGNMGGGITIDSWTTGTGASANYIRIFAPKLSSQVGTSQRHNGVYITSKFRIGFNATAFGITVQCGKLIVEGVQFDAAGTTAQYGLHFNNNIAGQSFTVSHCIFKGFGSGSSANGIRGFTTGGTVTYYISNNLVYDWTNATAVGIGISGVGATAYVYNNTVVDCQEGIGQMGGAVTITYKNNLSKCTGNDFQDAGTGSEYNASADATAPGTNSRINQTFTFSNEAGNDFRLAVTDAGARNFGKNLSGDANLAVTDDFVNTARPVGTAYDIGAHEEITSNAGGSRNVIIIND